MKRSKKIYILLGVLAIICVATFSVNKVKEHKEKIKNSDEIILEIPSDLVKSLSWEYESNNLAFHKDDKWYYDKDKEFPVSEEKINEFLAQFEEFGVAFIIEEVEDYSQYGLDKPICQVNLSTEDKSYEILLGNYSSMDSQRYVSIGDGNVYLVKKDPLDYFDATLNEMIDNDKTPEFDKVTDIKFEGDETYSITYEENSNRAYNSNDVYFTEIDGDSKPLDTARVNSYLRNITNLNLTNYVTYNVTEDKLKEYGLDTPELKVAVNYTFEDEEGKETKETFILNVSQDPKEKNAKKNGKKEDKKKTANKENEHLEEEEKEEITAYARVGESKIIYQITGDEYNNLMASSYDKLRHLEVICTDLADINRIDISLEGNNYTITSKKKGSERIYYYQEEEIDFTNFKSALQNLKADSFTKEEPTQKEEIRLTIHSENKNYPKTEIEFYRYDGTYCLVVIDGKPVSFVERTYVVDLIEAVHAIVLN